ncbi:hypothetical protein GCM10011511_54870 [Puia dinghuensis]|uniref:Glycosyltransferase 2-like domain-containing protein n=2 Tax=Puia dinghuensis TaxID=1792502 RepID=A0A8J2UIU2_9BACT|nr:hypothetical protein GCM10011511_54870 [Puia dinghuensis]
MLGSVRPIIDLIVAVDTGSSDKTISTIKEFGSSAGIPSFVFERPFDNFCNSRNYALDKLHNVVAELGWLPAEVWGLIVDCDEVLQISDKFAKGQLETDLYLVAVKREEEITVRRALFKLSGGFRWESPVHEMIVWKDVAITVSGMRELFIKYETKGASWKGNLEKKFLNYVRILLEHEAEGHSDCRTLYNIGDSYMAAADCCKSKNKAREYRLAAKKYYITALNLTEIGVQEKVIISQHLAESMDFLKEEWPKTQELLLSAYSLYMQKAESLAEIIRHYMTAKKWNIAYLFSSFAYKECNGRPPALDVIGGMININLYEWELLLYYSICCYFTGRGQEAKMLRKQLMHYVLTHMDNFTIKDLILIQYNSPFYLAVRSLKRRLRHQ